MKKNCVICGEKDSKVIYNKYPGYIIGTFFDINKCNFCGSHFISPEKDIKYIYDIIYSNTNTYGYDRYYNYANKVKNIPNPLKYLAYQESNYYPVYSYIKNKNKLKILEVGCGYGYLSYALHKAGHKVTAIDIATGAINFAKQNFGDYFHKTNLKEFSQQITEKYDLIIATEVIEHLEDPNDFIATSAKLLTPKGCILLTTPDKDYSNSNAIWQTDLPPVHLSWIGKAGINVLAKKNKMEVQFVNFSKYYSKHENRLVKYFVYRKEKIESSILYENGSAIMKKPASHLHQMVSKIVHKIPPIRFFSNAFYNLFNGSEITLGVVLQRAKNTSA